MNYNSLTFFIILFSLLGCNSTEYAIDNGVEYTFKSGYPEIRFSSSGIILEDDTPVIETSLEFSLNSFIFKFINGEKKAQVYYEIRLINKDNKNIKLKSDTLFITEKNDLSIETDFINNDFITEPGNYEVIVTVTDLISKKDVSISNQLFLPDPNNTEINITNINLSGKNNNSLNNSYFPITTYDIPSRIDSLNFAFQIVNNKINSPSVLEIKLIKFDSDSLPATSMSSTYQTRTRINRKGIDYRFFDVITSSTRYLSQNGSIYIEFKYPKLDKGNYRFEAKLYNDNGVDMDISRDFSIKSENFPYLLTSKELAEPLIYLMSTKEYNALISEKNENKLKQNIDKFWLSNINNPNIAAKVIKEYYERVEEANKLFSNYKEGWKTDVGKIYILFGYPWYIDKEVRNMRWSYSYNINDFETNFNFFLSEKKSKYFPFDVYLLRKNKNYYSVEYTQVQLWLSGLILKDNL
jgi:GWxTD domain-containing protein